MNTGQKMIQFKSIAQALLLQNQIKVKSMALGLHSVTGAI